MRDDLDYEVIATGSKGNAVRIENILIDCGISFKTLKPHLYKVDTLLLTHTHTDHIKPKTLSSIRKEFPHIAVYGNADIAYRFEVDKVIGTKPFTVKKKKINIIPFEGVHDVQTTCFIIQMKDMNILYATDTNKVNLPEQIPIDYCFLEANYDEKKLEQVYKQYSNRHYDAREGSLRHLSKQKCKEFYFLNRRNAESPLIELHMSSRFY